MNEMTAPPAITDADVLSALDFRPTLPCEHSQHATRHAVDQPATWMAHTWCECGRDRTYPICDSGRQRLLTLSWYCVMCGAMHEAGARVAFAPIFEATE